MELAIGEIEGDVMVIRADGGLNQATASQISEQVGALVAGGVRHLIVDCSSLTVLSSTGIGVLLMLHTRMKREGGDVRLCGLRGLIVQVLQLAKLDRLFQLYPDVGQAKLSFRPESD
ncbi:MAG: STAS domain-containing protein [Planctomycetes bacterium]|nr:STAS domain-containing protein [Planctomycetota bacterium]